MSDYNDPDMDPTQNPANYWMNTFYYNPEDKRLLPPKRIAGLGWTINFGNPYSVLLLIIILAALTLVSTL